MTTRKEFLAVSAALAASGALGEHATPGGSQLVATATRKEVAPRNRHPYQGIDWSTAQQIRGTTVEAETDKPARLEVITGVGKVKETKGKSVKWTMEGQYSASGPRNRAHVFARIKAYALDGSGEELFSQPYMLVPSSNGLVR